MAAARVLQALPPVRTVARRVFGRPLPSLVAAYRPASTLTSSTTAKKPAAPAATFRTQSRKAAASTPAAATPATPATPAETASLPDAPAVPPPPTGAPIDWTSSFHGLSTIPFSPEIVAILTAPLDPADVEVKPDGILYLPEIKYRRILQAAFGPGGWGLAPRGELAVGEKVVSREYALVAHGRYVGEARGECPYFGGADGVATAGEGCKSNALMRCCKDLGIASELWDPRFIREFKAKHCREVWAEHVVTKKKRQIWLRKDSPPVYPYALSSWGGNPPAKTTAR